MKKFVAPEIVLIKFDKSDILCSSGCPENCPTKNETVPIPRSVPEN